MPDRSSLGLVLIWLGTLALVAVLQHRIRRGAWKLDAEPHEIHPMERWAVAVAAVGLAAALVGTGMMLL